MSSVIALRTLRVMSYERKLALRRIRRTDGQILVPPHQSSLCVRAIATPTFGPNRKRQL